MTAPERPPAEKSTSRRRWHVGAILLAAVVALIAWQLYAHRDYPFEWELFARTFRTLHWNWLAAAMALAILSFYVRALRWAVMMAPMGVKPSKWGLFSATAIGFTAIVLLGRPGEFVRPYLIAIQEKVPFSSQVAIWMLERIYDLLVVLLLFGAGLARVQQSGAEVGPAIAWVLQAGGWFVGVMCTLSLLILILLRQFAEPMKKRLLDALTFLPDHLHARASHIVEAFVHGVASTRRWDSLLQLIWYTAIEWVVIVGCYLAIFKSFPAVESFSLIDTIIFLGFVAFGSLVQIPGVGGGVQIVAALVLVQLFGLPVEVATGIALMIWLVTFVIIVPLGVVLALHQGLNWKKLRRIKDLEAENVL
jgi:glycosyltransferase 2 family protein